MNDMQLRRSGLLRFECRCNNELHHFLCTISDVPKECELGSRVYFSRRKDVSRVLGEQIRKIGLRLNSPPEFIYGLLTEITMTTWGEKGRKIDGASTLSYFLEDNSVEVITGLLEKLTAKIKILGSQEDFWKWYFDYYGVKFRNIRTATATPLRPDFYKYDLQMFISDIDSTKCPVEIPGKDLTAKLSYLQRQYMQGEIGKINKIVSVYSKEGLSALNKRSELASQEYQEPKKRVARMFQKEGPTPEGEGSHFVRDSGKGGINRWSHY